MNSLNETSSARFLTLHLNKNIHGMFKTHEVEEVLRIQAGQILSIFDLNPYVMGVYNYRGEIIWLIDLPKLLGFPAVFEQHNGSHFSILLLELYGQRVGVGVRNVGTLWEGTPSGVDATDLQNNSVIMKACAAGIRRDAGQTYFALSRQRIFEQLKALENP